MDYDSWIFSQADIYMRGYDDDCSKVLDEPCGECRACRSRYLQELQEAEADNRYEKMRLGMRNF